MADKGQTDAINKGFARATGQVFAWLISDGTYQPGAIAEAMAYLEAHPETGMVYGGANLIDESGNVIGKFPARQTDYRRLRRGYVHIPQQAPFFRSDLWREVGPLDPTFYFAMDYDLWVRLSRVARLDYTPLLWANFRLHGNAKSVAPDDRCWPEMLRVPQREGGHWFSWLVLISSDVQVKGKFVEKAADILFGAKRSLVGNRHITFDTGWNKFDEHVFDYLEGWFLACSSDGWRDIGYFDEKYAPHDYEDIDLSTTAKKKGYKLVSLNNPLVTHLGGRTIGYNPTREAITNRNKEYFRKKWAE